MRVMAWMLVRVRWSIYTPDFTLFRRLSWKRETMPPKKKQRSSRIHSQSWCQKEVYLLVATHSQLKLVNRAIRVKHCKIICSTWYNSFILVKHRHKEQGFIWRSLKRMQGMRELERSQTIPIAKCCKCVFAPIVKGA